MFQINCTVKWSQCEHWWHSRAISKKIMVAQTTCHFILTPTITAGTMDWWCLSRKPLTCRPHQGVDPTTVYSTLVAPVIIGQSLLSNPVLCHVIWPLRVSVRFHTENLFSLDFIYCTSDKHSKNAYTLELSWIEITLKQVTYVYKLRPFRV